jgi:ABC-2 type transport system permease protein
VNTRLLQSEFVLRFRSLLWWTIGVAALAVFVDVFYPSVRDAPGLDELFTEIPESVQPLLGSVDFTSPVGYLLGQTYLFFLPAVLLVYAIGRSASTIAGEEEDGTLDLLLAQPISRTGVYLSKFAFILIAMFILSVATTLPTIVIGPALGLDVPVWNLVAVTLTMLAFLWFFAALTLAVSAGTGRKFLGITVASAFAFVTYLIDGLGQSIDLLQHLRPITPWRWYDATAALSEGVIWPGLTVLLVASAGVTLVGLWAFGRRNLTA